MELLGRSISDRRVVIFGLTIILVTLLALSFTAPVHRWGDGSTYYMMIDSIASDGDIKYEKKDIDRAFANQFDDLPAGLFLVKDSEGNFYYGKEYTYALFASPFFKLFGKNGILVFNSVMFFLMICMGYFYLRLNNSEIISLIASILFFLFSVWYIYIYWVHADLYNTFLVMAGFYAWFFYLHHKDLNIYNTIINKSHIFLISSLIIFGVAAFSKTPNMACAIPILLFELYIRDYKKFLFALLVFGLTFSTLVVSYFIITDNISPYKMQHGYVGNYPFTPDYNPDLDHGSAFAGDVFSKPSVISSLGLQVMGLNSFYYLFGRFTGIFWYYPFLLFSLFLYFTKKIDEFDDPILNSVKLGQWLIISAILINIFMYIFISYESAFNYFGGGHAVGNRYFYIYPAFLFLIGKIYVIKKTLGFLSLVLMVSILFVLPINLSPIETSTMPMEHTTHFPFKLLPLEYTLLDDNLPLWKPLPVTVDDNTFYFPRSNINVDRNIFIIQGDYPELLFKSKSKDKILIILINPDNEDDKLITLTSGSNQREFILEKGQATTLEMPIKPIVRIHGNSYIYKIRFEVSQLAPDSTENFIAVLGVPPSNEETFYFSGWYPLEYWDGMSFRWMEKNSTIMIYSDYDNTVDLNINAISFYRPRNLEIYVKGHPYTYMRSMVPSNNIVTVTVPNISLDKGANILRFWVPEGCEKPCEVMGTKDWRCLSLAVHDIKVIRDILIDEHKPPLISLAEGWHGLEDWGDAPTRWMQNDAVLLIESEDSQTAELSFKATSFYRPRTLEIYLGDALEMREVVNASEFAAINLPVQLQEGTNKIRFHAIEKYERPADIPELNNPDSRCLSLAFKDITISNI